MSLPQLLGGLHCQKHIIPLLAIRDLAQLQAVDSACKGVLMDDVDGWWNLVGNALPDFELSRDLFVPDQRRELMSFLPELLHASVAEGVKVKLVDMATARKLAKQLGVARRNCKTHMDRGGVLARTVLAHVRVSDEALADALQKGPRRPRQEAPLALGTPVTVPGSAPAGFAGGELRLHFAVDGGSLFVAARDDGVPSDHIDMKALAPWMWEEGGLEAVTANIVALSPGVLIHYHGLQLDVNGCWETTLAGIFTPSGTTAAAAAALSQGVLCVISVRDGKPDNQNMLAQTLGLDRVRY